MAGLMDGEGCFHAGIHGSNKISTRVFISNTNIDMLVWASETFGGSIVSSGRKNRTSDAWADQARWNLPAGSVSWFCYHIAPYLKTKREQAELMAELRETVLPISVLQNRRQARNPNTKSSALGSVPGYTADEQNKREALVTRIKELKKEGQNVRKYFA